MRTPNRESMIAKQLAYSSIVAVAVLLVSCGGTSQNRKWVQNDQTVLLTGSGQEVSGRDEYRELCGQCHGVSGRGNGPAASGFRTQPTNLTELRKGGGKFPYKMVYDTISGKIPVPVKAHGEGKMLLWTLALSRPSTPFGNSPLRRSDYEIDQEIKRITNYIESMQQS